MACCFRFLQYIVALFLLLSAALFVTSGAVNYWWVTNQSLYTSVESGLWKTCSNGRLMTTCHRRDDLFKFQSREVFDIQYGGIHKDIVLVCLAVGAVGTLIPLIFVAVTMCQRYPSKMTILIGTIFLFFGVVAGIFGTIWALVKIGSKNQGWAFYCLYAADGLSLLAFAFSVVLLCLSAPGAYRTTNRDDEIAMLAR